MKCPKCNKYIDTVNIISECWQKAELKENEIIKKKKKCISCGKKITNIKIQ